MIFCSIHFVFFVSSEWGILDNCIAGKLSPQEGEFLDLLSSFKMLQKPNTAKCKGNNFGITTSGDCAKTQVCGQLLVTHIYHPQEIDHDP